MDNKNTDLAPIVLFVYKRPDHTKKTLESLSKNELISGSELIIFADGPKVNATAEDLELIELTRQVCKSFRFSKKLTVIEHEKNHGLAKNIMDGVTQTLNRFETVIVLEDDLEFSPHFLHFMNDALTLYKNDEKVFHISGYWFPTKQMYPLPQTFFLNMATCWGWGTWRRAWNYFNSDVSFLREKIKQIDPAFKTFDYEGYSSFKQQLDWNIDGSLNTWAIRWYASIFVNEGLSLHPNKSFVNNFGFDGTGENCVIERYYWWDSLSKKVKIRKTEQVLSTRARASMLRFLQGMHPKPKDPFFKKIAKLFIPLSLRKYLRKKFLS